MTNRGQREILRWNPKIGQNFPELVSDIKHSKRVENIQNEKPETKIFTDYFEVYRGKLGDHLIDVNKDGSRRYYTTKDTPEGSLRTTSTGTFGSANNIITPSQNNLNPTQPAQPQIPQKLSSFDEWLEELKRKRNRKQNGIF